MSGHSKWANIKNKKEKTDSQRGKVFTKIGREIAIAVKEGGSDPANNSKLRDVIAKAKASNMPNDNIKRTIDKALGSGNTDNYESVTYEGYGPGGVAVIVEALTDNKNRTAGDLRISNYLLWQIAYSELYFTPVFWPDFTQDEFLKAIIDFQSRERRFGKTSEQVLNDKEQNQ